MMHGEFSPFFSRMNWDVIRAEGGSSFITTDSPVTFFNADFKPPAEPGPALYGTIVLFPINKHFLLYMSHPEFEQKKKRASDKLPENLAIKDGVIRVRKGVVWPAEQVHVHNYVMYQLSQDVIAGESKEILELALGQTLSGH